jgi:hypothetical protein
MTYKRAVLTTVAAFLVSEMLAITVHGFILANDYAPFYGTLLRRMGAAPSWQSLFLPVAHLSFVSALVWLFARLRLEGSPVLQGLRLGTLGWIMGPVPLWLLWYAEQPWPGLLVVKQLALEWLSSLIVGLTVAIVARQPRNTPGSLVHAK